MARLKGCQTGVYSIFYAISEASQNSSVSSSTCATEHPALPYFVVAWKATEKFLLGQAKTSPVRPWPPANPRARVKLLSEKPAQLALPMHRRPDSFLVTPSLLQAGPFPFFVSLHRAASQAGAVIRLSNHAKHKVAVSPVALVASPNRFRPFWRSGPGGL